jgi:hypothetical protein
MTAFDTAWDLLKKDINISELVCSQCGLKDEQANYNWDENAKSKCCNKWVRVKKYTKRGSQ